MDKHLEIGLKISGHFTLRKRKADTNEITQEVGPFSNLITNLGKNRIGTNASPITRAYVGTGTVAPAVTDTNLSTFLVASSSTSAPVNTAPTAPNWYAQTSITYTFAAGSVSNNITEVGVGWGTSPNSALWSRELIVDTSGNPVAITVLPNEILEVVYTLRHYVPQDDFSGTFTLGPNTYEYVGRALSAGSWTIQPDRMQQPLRMTYAYRSSTGLVDKSANSPSGVALAGTPGYTANPYVSGSYSRSATSSADLATWNTGIGINAIQIIQNDISFLNAFYQLYLPVGILKSNLNTMSFTWSYTWDRYTPPA